MCTRAPEGWICHLPEDHDGPCPAWPAGEEAYLPVTITMDGLSDPTNGPYVKAMARMSPAYGPHTYSISRSQLVFPSEITRLMRQVIAQEIRTYNERTHQPHAGNFACPRCDIEAVLLTVAKKVEAGTL